MITIDVDIDAIRDRNESAKKYNDPDVRSMDAIEDIDALLRQVDFLANYIETEGCFMHFEAWRKRHLDSPSF